MTRVTRTVIDLGGNNVAQASHGSMLNKMTAVIKIINTSVAKSSKCKDKNTHNLSVSLPMRVIKSPVRRPPKYSSESFNKCS